MFDAAMIKKKSCYSYNERFTLLFGRTPTRYHFWTHKMDDMDDMFGSKGKFYGNRVLGGEIVAFLVFLDEITTLVGKV